MTNSYLDTKLPDIKQFLDQQGYQTEIQEPMEFNPIEQLLVRMGKDMDNQELILRVFLLPETTERAPLKVSQDQEGEPRFLQFFILFPFLAIESTTPDLTKLLFHINSAFDMAQFGMYDNHMVYYRYVHICAEGKVAEQAIKAILVSLEFLIDALLPSIMDIALARKTLHEVQEEAKKAIQETGMDAFSS